MLKVRSGIDSGHIHDDREHRKGGWEGVGGHRGLDFSFKYVEFGVSMKIVSGNVCQFD